MCGRLWAAGVAIDPGRLIDDSDTAYYLTVVSAYRRFLEVKEEAAEAQRPA